MWIFPKSQHHLAVRIPSLELALFERDGVPDASGCVSAINSGLCSREPLDQKPVLISSLMRPNSVLEDYNLSLPAENALEENSIIEANWDETYSKELSDFHETGDCGEIWFGEDSVERIVRWTEKSPLIGKDDAILDLGCGNGILLVELFKNGYSDLTGVDYSQNAVQLAEGVAKEQNAQIVFQVCDILADIGDSRPDSVLRRTYNVLLDKGTYDAVSLNPEAPEKQRAKYIHNINTLLKQGGVFLITSCNWTEGELLQHFSEDLKFHDRIPAPTFQFGGVTGNRETVLVFQK